MKKFSKSKLVMLVMMLVLSCAMSSVVFADELVADGTYSIEVTSSSKMFKVVDAKLNVLDGNMSAVITLSGTGYSKLYMGTEEEAASSSEMDAINYVVDENNMYTYTIPVSALDTEINVAAFSIKKQTWYGRTLTFNSSTLVAIEEEQIVEQEEEQIEDIKEEQIEKTEESQEQQAEQQNVNEEIVVLSTQEEPIPKTGDNNSLVISTVVLIACVGIIAKNKKFSREA
jgi:hypothetical protein